MVHFDVVVELAAEPLQFQGVSCGDSALWFGDEHGLEEVGELFGLLPFDFVLEFEHSVDWPELQLWYSLQKALFSEVLL